MSTVFAALPLSLYSYLHLFCYIAAIVLTGGAGTLINPQAAEQRYQVIFSRGGKVEIKRRKGETRGQIYIALPGLQGRARAQTKSLLVVFDIK